MVECADNPIDEPGGPGRRETLGKRHQHKFRVAVLVLLLLSRTALMVMV